jgi:hypothetical protein
MIFLEPKHKLTLEFVALQAAARETLRLCRLSNPAQAGLEPQAPAPRGLSGLGAARRSDRLPGLWLAPLLSGWCEK